MHGLVMSVSLRRLACLRDVQAPAELLAVYGLHHFPVREFQRRELLLELATGMLAGLGAQVLVALLQVPGQVLRFQDGEADTASGSPGTR